MLYSRRICWRRIGESFFDRDYEFVGFINKMHTKCLCFYGSGYGYDETNFETA